MSMTLHVFNPSHDEALASGSPYYTPSQVARRMERELADFPHLWAPLGDVCLGDSFSWSDVRHIEPWGWDLRLRRLLRKAGAPDCLLPDDETLEKIRLLSSRRMVSQMLPEIVASCEGTFGESHFCTSEAETDEWLASFGESMLKAPWSCSGRGVFRCGATPTPSIRQRIRRIIGEQGGIEVQPFYSDGHDFAMEFECRDGRAQYLGISMFLTSATGQYLGNIIDSEENLLQRMESLSSDGPRTRSIYNNVWQKLSAMLSLRVAPHYNGPLGVDMLLVGSEIFPMTELNLRQTMGSVAIRLRERCKHPSMLAFSEENGVLKAKTKEIKW